MYTSVLLKLSGEMLLGESDGVGFDTKRATWIAGEVKKVADQGCKIAIMVGGGNLARGAQLEHRGITRVTGDYVGMMATMMNALLLADIFNHVGVPTRALSCIAADEAIDLYTHRRASNHLDKGRVVIIAGGTGRPYLTTDTGAVNFALDLGCEVVLKATKVDGVYDKDPATSPDAIKFEKVDYRHALENDNIKVMDKAAIGLAMEHHLPVIVFDLMQPDNIAKAARQSAGTLIS